jgi:hypothetical protein
MQTPFTGVLSSHSTIAVLGHALHESKSTVYRHVVLNFAALDFCRAALVAFGTFDHKIVQYIRQDFGRR